MANIITPRRREDFFDSNGDPTLRFLKWMESVTSQTNTSTSTIEIIETTIEVIESSNVSFTSILQQTIKRLDGLSEFTIDTSGFTTDTTLITADKVIA